MFGVLKRKERRRLLEVEEEEEQQLLADLMPKVDISGQIKSDLIKELGDKNWKIRGEALQKVSCTVHQPLPCFTITHPSSSSSSSSSSFSSGARYHSSCQVCPAIIRRPTRSSKGTSGRLKQKSGVYWRCGCNNVVTPTLHPLIRLLSHLVSSVV